MATIERAAAVALLLVLQPFAPQQRGRLLVGSHIYEEEVRIRSGERWVGLFHGTSGWSLDSVTVRVALADTVCGRTLRVSWGRRQVPVFLARNIDSLSAGPVPASITTELRLQSGQQRVFGLGPDQYRLEARGDSGLHPRNYELRLLRLRDGRFDVLAANHPRAGIEGIAWPPRIRWVGDLDHDGLPDAVVDTHMYETPDVWELFLSSAATNGHLLRRVATHAGMDC